MSVQYTEQEDALKKASKASARWQRFSDMGFVLCVGLGAFVLLSLATGYSNPPLFSNPVILVFLGVSVASGFLWWLASRLYHFHAKSLSLLLTGLTPDDADRWMTTMSNEVLSEELINLYEDIERHQASALKAMRSSFDEYMLHGFDFRPSFVQELHISKDGRKTYFLHRFYRLGVPAEIVAVALYKCALNNKLRYNPSIFACDDTGRLLREQSPFAAKLGYWFGYRTTDKIFSAIIFLTMAGGVYAIFSDNVPRTLLWTLLFLFLTAASFVWIGFFIRRLLKGKLRFKWSFQNAGLLFFGVIFFLMMWVASLSHVFLIWY